MTVDGFDVARDPVAVKQRIAVVPQRPNLDRSLTAMENLVFHAAYFGEPRGARRRRAQEMLDRMGLGDRGADKVDEYSGGMAQRLMIARALMHEPRLLVLDEPTVGLDPQVRQELWALIDRMRSDGVSILMSTHYIEEAERLCDEVTIMSHGRAVAVGAPRALIAEHAGPEAIEVYGPPLRLSEVEADALARGWRTRRTGTSVAVLHTNGSDLEGERRVTNLEDVFVLLTGEEIA